MFEPKNQDFDCPECGRKRWMHIVHVDQSGNPDQSQEKVLLMVSRMQADIATATVGALMAVVVIAAIVVGILMAVGVIPSLW